MKNNYLFYNFKAIVNTQKYKIVLLCLIINSLYGGFVVAQPGINSGYFNTILHIYTSPYFIMILLIVIMLNTMQVRSFLFDNYEYIIRLKTKKEQMKKLIQNIVFNNFIVFMIQLILILIISNIFYSDKLGIEMLNLGVNNLFYLIFYLIRTFVLIVQINILNIYLHKFINKSIIIILNLFIYVSIPSGLILYIFKIGNIHMPIYIGNYFGMVPYPNFLSEILGSIMIIGIMSLFIGILKTVKKEKE